MNSIASQADDTGLRDNRLLKLRDAMNGAFARASSARVGGIVTEIASDVFYVSGLSQVAHIGDLIERETAQDVPLGQVIRIDQERTVVRAFSSLSLLSIGSTVWHKGPLRLNPHPSWRGRSFDGFGNCIDGKGRRLVGLTASSVEKSALPALERNRVTEAMPTGIKVIDLFTPMCNGQRVGIFAGSGVGKSTLLQMLAQADSFDTIVICLVGERGREVREFLEDGLGSEAERCVCVIATSDESALVRKLAPFTALTIAEYFRDRGDNVLLLADSITRFAHAARDVAISAGEPPVQRGYPPSVFADIARLLERAGPGTKDTGAITGIFSVLVDGDNHDEPIADSVRGILDGHIVLDRSIAALGRYPAVDPVQSISRLATHIWTPQQQEFVQSMRAMISRYEETKDLRIVGGYQPGNDERIDQAVALTPLLYDFLQQSGNDPKCADVFSAAADALRVGLAQQ